MSRRKVQDYLARVFSTRRYMSLVASGSGARSTCRTPRRLAAEINLLGTPPARHLVWNLLLGFLRNENLTPTPFAATQVSAFSLHKLIPQPVRADSTMARGQQQRMCNRRHGTKPSYKRKLRDYEIKHANTMQQQFPLIFAKCDHRL